MPGWLDDVTKITLENDNFGRPRRLSLAVVMSADSYRASGVDAPGETPAAIHGCGRRRQGQRRTTYSWPGIRCLRCGTVAVS